MFLDKKVEGFDILDKNLKQYNFYYDGLHIVCESHT